MIKRILPIAVNITEYHIISKFILFRIIMPKLTKRPNCLVQTDVLIVVIDKLRY